MDTENAITKCKCGREAVAAGVCCLLCGRGERHSKFCNEILNADGEATVRRHFVRWNARPVSGKWVLADALGVDRERSAAVDAMVQRLIADGKNLITVTQAIADTELTDGEFAVAMYALGWFDHATRGDE